MKTVIINYGMGNLASVSNMIRKVGGDCMVSDDADEISVASKLVLPGVGAFDHGIKQLHSLGLFNVIRDAAREGIPILGICLGMQLLTRRSEEGVLDGLSLIDAECVKFSFDSHSRLRIPHVGWNIIKIRKENPLVQNDLTEPRFYFTHSFYVICNNPDDILATANYGDEFVCAFQHKSTFGVQFHPEKSHRFGMALMKRFIEL
jgi:glutamine amidotransferase